MPFEKRAGEAEAIVNCSRSVEVGNHVAVGHVGQKPPKW